MIMLDNVNVYYFEYMSQFELNHSLGLYQMMRNNLKF